jgi:succinoglycan biosynthesis protein ExoL
MLCYVLRYNTSGFIASADRPFEDGGAPAIQGKSRRAARRRGVNVKIAYFVPDLTDSAARRRVRMFVRGGAEVAVAGFRRSPSSVAGLDGATALDLGRTRDGRLLRRAASAVGAALDRQRLAQFVGGADVIVARNLETLLPAARARALSPSKPPLVYECLDIHRLLLSRRGDGRLLRAVEDRLWREVDLGLTSSPAFVRNYFAPRGFPAPIRVIENKVLALAPGERPSPPPRPAAGPPWRIGWFGILRCRRSLDLLSRVTRAAGGAIEVVLRGKPSMASLVDLERRVAGEPFIQFAGPYRNPEDLPAIYGDVHFAWAVDYFEAGGNSEWLLPNRIYESCAYGAPPIALASVETGRWLTARGVGLSFAEPLEDRLAETLGRLDAATYAELAGRVARLRATDVVCGDDECRALVDALRVGVRREGAGAVAPIGQPNAEPAP